MTLGTPDEVCRPVDAPTDPLDGTDNLTLPLDKSMAPNPGATGTTLGTGAVRIDDSPTHNHPSNPTQSKHPTQTPRSILRKLMDSLSLQLNNNTSNEARFSADSLNNGKGKVIHDKTHKVLKEMTGNHYIEFHVEDFAGLFPIWQIVELPLTPPVPQKMRG